MTGKEFAFFFVPFSDKKDMDTAVNQLLMANTSDPHYTWHPVSMTECSDRVMILAQRDRNNNI